MEKRDKTENIDILTHPQISALQRGEAQLKPEVNSLILQVNEAGRQVGPGFI